MENAYILTGLIKRRAEITGQLEDAQMRVRHLIIDVDAVDAVLRQFDPAINLEMIRPEPVPPRHTAFHGRITRMVLVMLREAGLPLTTKDIALRVVTERGLNAADPRLTWTVHKRVGACLRHLRTKGQVVSAPGRGSNVRWTLA